MKTTIMSRKSVMTGLLAAAALAAASAAGAAGVGTTGANFLNVGVGARPLAMGSAFTALPDDANAINWNPGALGVQKERSVTASYNALFDGENQGFIGYAHPMGENSGTFAAGLNYLMISNIPKRAGDTESPDSTFNNTNLALSGSYARKTPIEGLALGGTFKYIRESLDTFSANTVAVDFGGFYQTPVPHLTAGAMLSNFGGKIGPDPLPTSLRGGAAYKLMQDRLVLASDVDWHAVDRRAYWNLGVEGWTYKALALRAGYQVGRAADSLGSSLVGFSFGLGVSIEKFRMDYAFLPFGNLGDTHRITLGWSF